MKFANRANNEISILSKYNGKVNEVAKVVKRGGNDVIEIVDHRILDKLNGSEAAKVKLTQDVMDQPALLKAIGDEPELVDAWKKLDDAGVNAALRKDPKALDWISKQGDNIPSSTLDDLSTNLNGKTVERTFEDAQGRLVVLTESTGSTRTVVTVEKTAAGEIKSFKYTQAYNKASQPGMPPVSANGLAPDFSGNSAWLYPVSGNQKNIVKIRLSGKRKGTDGDFHRANQEAGFPTTSAPEGYTWHHMDDYNPVTGESTMQLVKTTDHTATLPHTDLLNNLKIIQEQIILIKYAKITN